MGSYPVGNSELVSLAGLTALGSVGGHLGIACNAHLAEIGGLGKLEFVGGDLVLYENVTLSALDGLGGVGGALRDVGGVYIVECSPQLDAAQAEAVLAEVGYTVETTIDLACN